MHPTVQTYNYLHKTTTGNTYPIEIGLQIVNPLTIPFDRLPTLKACQEGCKMYSRNGGCPPYSPNYTQLRQAYPFGLVLYAKLFTKDYPSTVLNGSYFVRWSFAENILARLLTRIGHEYREAFGGMFLSTGRCIGCRKCIFQTDSTQCSNPSKRTFSMEATGILVGDLIDQALGFPLQWWNPNDPSIVPEYMTKVILLLNSEPLTIELIKEILPA